MTTITAHTHRRQTWLGLLFLSAAVVVVSFGAVHSPYLVAGAVIGAAVLTIALAAPLALVAFMLVTGPISLSFATGGFKALFSSLGGLDMNGIRLVGASAGFLAYIMFDRRSRAAAVGPLGRPWLVFLMYAAVTLGISLDRIEGLRFLFKLAYPFLTFLIVVGVADTRERALMLLKWTLLAAAVYVIVINPMLFAFGSYHYDHEGILRFGGVAGGEQPLAYYLLPMLMIAFARFLLRLELRYMWFSIAMIGWIGLTGLRIAALAAVMGMLLIGVLAAWHTNNRKIVLGVVVTAALAGATFLPTVLARSFGFVPTASELFTLFRDPMALYNSINWSGRQLLWAVLWGAFITSPIIGLGLGSSTAVIREMFHAGNIHDAHNDYIRLATDTGLLGVLLFVIAVSTWFVGALRLSRSDDRDVRELAYAGAAVAIAVLIVGITDNAANYYTNMTQYLGFFVACAVILHNDRKQAVAET